jgi:ribosomal protein S7
MVKKYRDLTEKYKGLRLIPDVIYHSRLIRTLLNKFIRSGKKATARRHAYKALAALRHLLRQPRLYNTLLRVLRSLKLQFSLIAQRQAKQIIEVPTPIRRNKADIMNIQTLFKNIKNRRERALFERICQEMLALTLERNHSSTLRQKNAYIKRTYDERVNIDQRWR